MEKGLLSTRTKTGSAAVGWLSEESRARRWKVAEFFLLMNLFFPIAGCHKEEERLRTEEAAGGGGGGGGDGGRGFR